jgi:hypothetical protein
MRRLTDTQLMIGAVIALAIIAVFVAIFGYEGGPALSIHSVDPEGAMALRLWLEKQGYSVRELNSKPIQPEEAAVLFILAPLEDYPATEIESLGNWVRSGHTLIVAGYPSQVNGLMAPYGLLLDYHFENVNSEYSQPGPTFLAPPFDKAKIAPIAFVTNLQPDTVVALYDGYVPLLVSRQFGRGRVWLTGALRPFSNIGLQDEANARIVLNMLAKVPKGAVIAFDEARHGFGATRSISAWLFNTPPGWGALAAVALTMAYLALSGRRFGRPVPLPDERLRREPVEYIRAMANLFRRSGQRAEMLKHYRGQLRRRLSERYSVDPRLDDIELVKTVAFRDPSIDAASLRTILARLSRTSISEAELVNLVADVDEWVRRLT